MSRPSFVLRKALPALLLTACAPAAVAPDDPFADTGASAQGLGVTCVGANACSGPGDTISATYRIGATSTSRGDLAQTFVATTAGTPSSVTLMLRSLRPFASGSTTRVYVKVFGPVNPASVQLGALSPLAEGEVSVAAFGPGGVTPIALSGSGALVEGSTYVFTVWTDDLQPTDTGALLIGVGSLASTTYAGGVPLRRGLRRVDPGSPWGEARFMSAGTADLAFAFGPACDGPCVPPDTSIVSGPPASTTASDATFSFACTGTSCSFDCRLDAGAFAPCTSPVSWSALAVGAHVFAVRASDAHGTDPSPVTHPWTVTTGGPQGLLAAAVGVGNDTTTAVGTDGRLWTFGANWDGQLGLGGSVPRSADVPLPLGTATDWVAASAGESASCALQASGGLWCWGRNWGGEAGVGHQDPVPEPTAVTGGAPWARISVGNSTCGIRTDGTLWCWGPAYSGQLGIGPTSESSLTTPQPVGSATDWTAVSVGNNHACGLRNGGELFCWGTTAEVSSDRRSGAWTSSPRTCRDRWARAGSRWPRVRATPAG